MKRRKLTGAVLITVSGALTLFVVREVTAHITLTGLFPGGRAIYDAPFETHGLLVVLSGISALILLLAGLHLLGPGRKK